MIDSQATVGILSIGDMGVGIAKLLITNKFRVVTNVSDRSQDTQSRAHSASITLLPNDVALVEESDYILSIVPPRDATEIAERIQTALRHCNRQKNLKGPLYYLDLNAISPSTSHNIEDIFADSPDVRLLDGGIIGGPPKITTPDDFNPTWYKPSVVVSGPHSLHDAINGLRLANVLNLKHISKEIGSATGLKMCFASMSKGFTAIAIEAFTTAEKMGVLPELREHLEEYNPAMGAVAERSVVGMAPKAYRWVAEMEEIQRTMEDIGGFNSRDRQIVVGSHFSSKGRGGDLFKGVSDVYRFVADETELGKEKVEDRKKGKTPEEVAKICADELSKRVMKKK